MLVGALFKKFGLFLNTPRMSHPALHANLLLATRILATHSDSDMLVAVTAFVECSNGLGDDCALTPGSSLDDAARIRPGNVGRI
jgi:hypothetical protein